MTAYLSRGSSDIGELSAALSGGHGRLLGIVNLNAYEYIVCETSEQALDFARAFTECAALMERRQREDAHTETLDVQP